ncbi:hypothetical protein [Micromonospora halophytica]|uniref:Uncharacterized protein n=1 Tax=Micromonospora halophytica TaxID=47864 RepID=A0A1C5J8H0_9ACTN|nr:hypothetical protein [Micromonospora halophytica]SCG66346.1 hypothetical protein GA0070560_12333 [Micromonospora halophytica]
MSQAWKTATIIIATAVILSTPLVWLLGNPDKGQMVGASVQAGAGVLALLWGLFQRTAGGPNDRASRTGEGTGRSGGRVVTGVRRPGGKGTGSSRASRTGKATAVGKGSSATTGIDYGD